LKPLGTSVFKTWYAPFPALISAGPIEAGGGAGSGGGGDAFPALISAGPIEAPGSCGSTARAE